MEIYIKHSFYWLTGYKLCIYEYDSKKKEQIKRLSKTNLLRGIQPTMFYQTEMWKC